MLLKKEIQIGDDSLTLESGKIARQADGSCTVRLGDTIVLSSACMVGTPSPRSFLPLTRGDRIRARMSMLPPFSTRQSHRYRTSWPSAA